MMRTGAILSLALLMLPTMLRADTTSVTVTVQNTQCIDGIDNDGDLQIDYPADPGCSSAIDNDETDPVFHCNDSIDNDSDGFTDYPSDPGCDSATDTSEFNIPSGGGGGGGGGSGGGKKGGVNITLSGNAYPRSEVILYRGSRQVMRTIAGPDARFTLSTALDDGNHVLSIVAEDASGVRSSLFTLPITLSKGSSTTIGGIFLSPTLSVRGKEFKRGDTVTFFGQSVPGGAITLEVNSEEPHFFSATSDTAGSYFMQVNSSMLELGSHSAHSKATQGALVSPASPIVSFKVSLTGGAASAFLKGDLNKDGRVNVLDFSIAAYWYKRALSAVLVADEAERLSGDAKVDLIDFSIMAYHWTN